MVFQDFTALLALVNPHPSNEWISSSSSMPRSSIRKIPSAKDIPGAQRAIRPAVTFSSNAPSVHHVYDNEQDESVSSLAGRPMRQQTQPQMKPRPHVVQLPGSDATTNESVDGRLRSVSSEDFDGGSHASIKRLSTGFELQLAVRHNTRDTVHSRNSIGRLIFGRRRASAIWRTYKRYSLLFNFFGAFGIYVNAMGALYDGTTGRVLSNLVLLWVPLGIMLVLQLNTGLLRRLLGYFEPWYLLANNVVCFIAFASLVQWDYRLVTCAGVCSHLTLMFLYDAWSKNSTIAVCVSHITTLLIGMCWMVYFHFDLVPNLHDAEWSLGTVTWTTRTMMTASLANMLLYLLKNLVISLSFPFYFFIISDHVVNPYRLRLDKNTGQALAPAGGTNTTTTNTTGTGTGRRTSSVNVSRVIAPSAIMASPSASEASRWQDSYNQHRVSMDQSVRPLTSVGVAGQVYSRATISRALFGKDGSRKLYQFYKRSTGGYIFQAFALVNMFFVFYSLTLDDHHLATVLSACSSSLLLPFFAMVFLHCNAQLLSILLGYWEVWFITWNSILFNVGYMDILKWDMRCFQVVVFWCGLIGGMYTDSWYRAPRRHIIAFQLAMVLYVVSVEVMLHRDMIPDTRRREFNLYSVKWSMADLQAGSGATLTMFFIKNLFLTSLNNRTTTFYTIRSRVINPLKI